MRSICLLLMLVAYSSFGFCQNTREKDESQSWPIMIAFSAHSYSWPIVKSFVLPIQPGLKIGTEYVYSTNKNHTILQTLTLGYFRNPEFLQAVYFDTYFTYRYTTSFHMFVDGAVGTGYLHRRHTREAFKLNDNGEFESKTDWGSPAVKLGLTIGLGYNFYVKNHQLSTFINYEWFINYPHVKGLIPLLPHSLYHIGIRYYPFK